jgi:hypothetical protein
VILLSKYFSSANENKKSEKIEINIDGINVNRAKKVIYFLFDFDPSTSISFLMVFFISKKTKRKKNKSKTTFVINKYCRFLSSNWIKLLSINVKKVKKPTNNVTRKIRITNIFFLINSIIMQ